MDLKNNKVTVGELMEHPGARAVLQRRFPMLMKHPVMGAARAHGHGEPIVAVEHGVVLDVGVPSDPDGGLIPPEHRAVPEAGAGLHGHLSHHNSGLRHPGGRINLRPEIAIGLQHCDRLPSCFSDKNHYTDPSPAWQVKSGEATA